MAAGWTRMNREDAHQVLDKLSSHRDAVLFSKETTEVSFRTLPFYSHYRLYRLINYATMPTFRLTYLSDGEDFISLDGTANPLYTANEKDPIRLNEMTVIPYLDFFFMNVQGSEGEVFLIKDPRKMLILESLSAAQRKSVIDTFKPLRVSSNIVQHTYNVTGTIYYGGGLIAATIQITHEGKLSFLDQNLLLSGIHFPAEPYSQAWLEG
jgi:hypothetical protein